MFDNAIFASLIPQFLMVLGFFSVIIAPSLANTENPAVTSKVLQAETFTIHSEINNSEKIIFFSDFKEQYIEKEEITKTPISPFVRKIPFSTFDFHFLSEKIIFRLFSRPPPFLFS